MTFIKEEIFNSHVAPIIIIIIIIIISLRAVQLLCFVKKLGI